MLRLNPAQFVLSAICGALAILLGYMLLAPLPEIALPQVETPSQPADDTPLARFDAPSRQAFAEVDDRSVFNPARARISAPFQPGAASATSLPTDLSLVGVILDKDMKLALFKSPSAPLAVGVPVGGSVEGWQVTRIEPDTVALRAGGPEQVMRVSANKAAPPGPNVVRPFGPPNFPRPPNFARNNPNINNNNGNNENNNNNDNSDDDDNN